VRRVRGWVLPALGLVLLAACTKTPTSGIRGDLTYVGGPAPGNADQLEPGRVVAYTSDGGEAGSADFVEGVGFQLALPPDTYVLVASSGDAICPHKSVTIVEDQYETVHFKCGVM